MGEDETRARHVPDGAANGTSEDPGKDEQELRQLRSDAAAQQRDIVESGAREHRQEILNARLRAEATVREADLAVLCERLEAAEHELQDLRAIGDALTPPDLPQRPGLQLAAAFLPAAAEQVSGDFYLVAEGPQDSTCWSSATSSAMACRQAGVQRSSGRRSPRPHRSQTIPAAC